MPKKFEPIAMVAKATINAAEVEAGEETKPATFEVTAYNGGLLKLAGWDRPVVVDLQALKYSRSLVANLDHDSKREVGHVTSKVIKDNQVVLSGEISRNNEAAHELKTSPRFPWQASIEADPLKVRELAEGSSETINGQTIDGPAYVATAELRGFAFLSRGADRKTEVSIAAMADKHKEQPVDKKLEAFLAEQGITDLETVDENKLATLKASFEGKPAPKAIDFDDDFAKLKAEQERKQEITQLAMKACDGRFGNEIDAIQSMAQNAIKAQMPAIEFRLKLMEASAPGGITISAPRQDSGLNEKVLEAAVCQAANLEGIDKEYSDQTLQAAHDRFKGRVGLNQLFMLCAESRGYRGQYERTLTLDAHNAAWGLIGGRTMEAAGFSSLNTPVMLSNIANKFLMRGWNFVEQAWRQIARIRNVNDFKTVTTTSLVGDTIFEKVGATGQITHGGLSEEVYTNKADTYARMLSITRQDFQNDDLGALTDTPMELGKGGGKKLNDIFWAMFLDNAAFFTTARGNVVEGGAGVEGQLNSEGLSTAETTFVQQTDPTGDPLGSDPKILLTPVPLKNTARQLMESDKVKGSTDEPDANIWQGRFTSVSSRYMTNGKYTGNSAVAWYLLADPTDMAVIEIAALFGRVEPVIESADAAFNVLGSEFRGYSDVGVNLQEYRGGVRADGVAKT